MNEGSPKGKQKRKRILFVLKVGLALAILVVILANVKVNDHLTLPVSAPFAGVHTGTLEESDQEGEMVFRKKKWFVLSVPDETFLFKARLEDMTVLSGSVSGSGEFHVFTEEECKDIELREGLFTVLKQINLGYWALSILIYFSAMMLTAKRWSFLLRAVALPLTWLRAFRLTYIGIFFNNVVPGQTGGDLVRAYYIARVKRERKTDSILTVIVDRGLGITALAMIGAVVILTDLERFGASAPVTYGFIGLVVVGSLIYFSKRIRRFFKLDVLLRKLPFTDFFQKVDRSIFLYRYRKRTLLVCFIMSIAIHLTIITAIWVLGGGLGIDLPLVSYMAFIPIIFIISSLPLTPSGWGVGELSFVYFLSFVEVPGAQAMALSLVFRLNATLLSMIGGVFLLLEKDRILPSDVELENEKPGVTPEGEER
jgi:uncharacterized protein (TIRG00374 family)